MLLVAAISSCGLVAGGPGSLVGRMMGGGGSASGSGSPGFVSGTVVTPRVVRIVAGPGDRFNPSDVSIHAGETVTFEVTTMGPTVHEFKLGPLDAVKADAADLPEIASIGMMQSGSLTYTFDGAGPFGFACHEPGHFEAGMWGTITIVP